MHIVLNSESLSFGQNSSPQSLHCRCPITQLPEVFQITSALHNHCATFLVDLCIQLPVHNQDAQDVLHFGDGYPDLLRNVCESESRVWCYQFQNCLGSHIPTNLVDVFGYE